MKIFTAAIRLNEDPKVTVLTDEGPKPKTPPEHAFDATTTLCGLPQDVLRVMRRSWSPRTKPTCTVCRAIFETTYSPGGVPEGYPGR
jgi:hypothetical protein